MTYTVDVVREGSAWTADVVDLPGAHTYAPTLDELHTFVREVIVLMADLPDAAEPEFAFRFVSATSATP